MKRMFYGLNVVLVFLFIGSLSVDAAQSTKVDFQLVKGKAQALSTQPYAPPEKVKLPKKIEDLNMEQYQKISHSNKFLWASDNLPFEAGFFPLGYNFFSQVIMNEFKGDFSQKIRFNPDFFSLNGVKGVAKDMPSDAGYSGFKLLTQLNKPGKFDEFIAFLGGSYFRALGRGNTYGLSSRGLSINTMLPGVREEFPVFTEFWMGKPDKMDTSFILYALLNSESVTGAYEFTITPGKDTVIKIRSALYFRKEVQQIGLCPLTSFFWFGENSNNHFNDFRPEVHDSDGLIISAGEDNHIWEPLVNYSSNPLPTRSNYHFDKINYYGLLQRDRDYSHYLDPEHSYNLEANVWITPGKNWGAGAIRLIVLPTNNEFMDNVALLWVPDVKPVVGKEFDFDYTMHWSMENPPIPADIATVQSTRHGINHADKKQTFFVVNFSGGKLKGLAPVEPIEAKVNIGSGAKLVGVPDVSKVGPDLSWRVKFILEQGEDSKNEPVDLKCTLFYKGKKISEQWNYKWRFKK